MNPSGTILLDGAVRPRLSLFPLAGAERIQVCIYIGNHRGYEPSLALSLKLLGSIVVRYIKILLSLAVALWGLLGGLGNLANYQEGKQSVQMVLSKETLPDSAAPERPSEPNQVLVAAGFAFIWMLKLLGGALCLVGAIRMWSSRTADTAGFEDAKQWAISGCGVLLFMLFFGFSLVAVGPFKLYLSPMVSAVELAALFAAQIGIVMLFLNQRET